MWTDSHCHIASEADTAEQLVAAHAARVDRLVTVGTDAAHSAAAVAVARAYPGVWATVGLHPHDATEGLAGIVAVLDEAGPEVVAVGECGLDYHYDHSPRAIQREVFAAQIRLAHERDLALVIHTRSAWDDTLAILEAEGAPARTVLHCFSGGPPEAERCLALGAYLSFSGIVTFPSAPEVRAAAAACPLERLLVETDAPWLAPVPHRGKPNRPALVPVVGAALAMAKGLSPEVVAAATTANATTVFRLPG
jgi:TatD DNase family protein